MRAQEKDHHLARYHTGLCVVRSPANPIRLEFAKRRLDGQTSRSSLNRGRVHPGPPGETTGAWAPSFSGGVKGDWPTGQPLGRATGGPFHRVAQNLRAGGLYLPLVILSCLVINSVDCRSTGYQPKAAPPVFGKMAEGRHPRQAALRMSLPADQTAQPERGRPSVAAPAGLQNSRSHSASAGNARTRGHRTRSPRTPRGEQSRVEEPVAIDVDAPVVIDVDNGDADPVQEPPPSRPRSPPRAPPSPAHSVNSSRSRASTTASSRHRLALSEAENQTLRAELGALRARGTPMRLEAVEEHGTGPAPAGSASGATPRDPRIESQPLALSEGAGHVDGSTVVLPVSDVMHARPSIVAGQPPTSWWTALGTVIQLNQMRKRA